jgi:hypothetical protein
MQIQIIQHLISFEYIFYLLLRTSVNVALCFCSMFVSHLNRLSCVYNISVFSMSPSELS